MIVGEDLGTVPKGVRMAMERHKLGRMFIAPFELNFDPIRGVPLNPIPANALVALNTHDMPPFAGLLAGTDLEFQQQMGWLTPQQVAQEHQNKKQLRQALAQAFQLPFGNDLQPSQIEEILRHIYDHLARSRAPLLLVNCEDLWAETFAQNVPGTWREWPNWRHKFQLSLEEICASTKLSQWLQHLSQLRKTPHTSSETAAPT